MTSKGNFIISQLVADGLSREKATEVMAKNVYKTRQTKPEFPRCQSTSMAGSGRTGNKYVTTQVTLEEGETGLRPMIHHLILFAETGLYLQNGNHDLTVSHNCNNPQCTTLEHFSIETLDVNQSRKCCRLFRGKTVSDGRPYACPHVPLCVEYIDDAQHPRARPDFGAMKQLAGVSSVENRSSSTSSTSSSKKMKLSE